MDNKFDKFMRDKLSNREFEMKDAHWLDALDQIESQDKQKVSKKNRNWLLGLLLLLFICLGSSIFFTKKYSSNSTEISSTQHEKNDQEIKLNNSIKNTINNNTSALNSNNFSNEKEISNTSKNDVSVSSKTANFASEKSDEPAFLKDKSKSKSQINKQSTSRIENTQQDEVSQNATSDLSAVYGSQINSSKPEIAYIQNNKKTVSSNDRGSDLQTPRIDANIGNTINKNYSTTIPSKELTPYAIQPVDGTDNTQTYGGDLKDQAQQKTDIYGLTTKQWKAFDHLPLLIANLNHSLEQPSIKRLPSEFNQDQKAYRWIIGLDVATMINPSGENLKDIFSNNSIGLFVDRKIGQRLFLVSGLRLKNVSGKIPVARQTFEKVYSFGSTTENVMLLPNSLQYLQIPLGIKLDLKAHFISTGFNFDILLSGRGGISQFYDASLVDSQESAYYPEFEKPQNSWVQTVGFKKLVPLVFLGYAYELSDNLRFELGLNYRLQDLSSTQNVPSTYIGNVESTDPNKLGISLGVAYKFIKL